MRKLLIAFAAAALSACVAAVPAPTAAPGPARSAGHGPPPWAPAHGYRAKTPQGVDVAFDSQLGVYVVLSVPDQYWLDQLYYRKRAEDWFVSPGLDGPWSTCAAADLPEGLRAGRTPPGQSKAKKGNGPPN